MKLSSSSSFFFTKWANHPATTSYRSSSSRYPLKFVIITRVIGKLSERWKYLHQINYPPNTLLLFWIIYILKISTIPFHPNFQPPPQRLLLSHPRHCLASENPLVYLPISSWKWFLLLLFLNRPACLSHHYSVLLLLLDHFRRQAASDWVTRGTGIMKANWNIQLIALMNRRNADSCCTNCISHEWHPPAAGHNMQTTRTSTIRCTADLFWNNEEKRMTK